MTPEQATTSKHPVAVKPATMTTLSSVAAAHEPTPEPRRATVSGLGYADPGTFVSTQELCRFLPFTGEAAEKWGDGNRFASMFRMQERPLWWKDGAPNPPMWPGATLAVQAGRLALQRASISAQEVTHLIYISCTPDQTHFRGDANRIRRELGCYKARITHHDLGCGGIANAYFDALQWITAGLAEQVLILTANSTSPFMIDPALRARYVESGEWFSLCMFADAAGAVLISATKGHPVVNGTMGIDPIKPLHAVLPEELAKRYGLDRVHFHRFRSPDFKREDRPGIIAGCLAELDTEPLMHVEDGGANHPTGSDIMHRLHGRPVTALYDPLMLAVIDELQTLSDGVFKPQTAKKIFVHQANGNVVASLARALGMSDGDPRLPIHTERYGNLVATSTTKLMLDALDSGALASGDIVCIASIGAGATTGGIVLRV